MRHARTGLALALSLIAVAPAPSRAAEAQAFGVLADTPQSLVVLQRLAPAVEHASGVRILPMAGKGPVQTLTDLIKLRGIDAALVSSDTLAYMERNNLIGGLDSKLAFIVRLGGLDIHVIARKGIDSLADLGGKTVVTGRTSGEAFAAGEFLRDAAGTAAKTVPGDGAEAVRAVAEGRADAAILVGHKPLPELRGLTSAQGLHLLSLEAPDGLSGTYAPALLSHADYPQLIGADSPVQTVSASLAIAVFNWRKGTAQYERTRRLAAALFETLQPTPDQDAGMNLAAAVPGWTRHGTAEDVLAAMSAKGKDVTP